MTNKARYLYLDDSGDQIEGMDGGVFITNVVPVDSEKIVDITYKENETGKLVVDSIETNTNDVIVTAEWDGIAFSYDGKVSINSVNITNTIELDNTRRFSGSVQIDLSGFDSITALHEYGTVSVVPITFQGSGPEILSVHFNGYPGTQTEVKENDSVNLTVTFNPSGSEPSFIEIYDYGACKYLLVDVSTTELIWGSVYTASFQVIINSTSEISTQYPCKCRAKNNFGTYGNSVFSNDDGMIDGINVLWCNDIIPSFSDLGTTFPPTQLAFKLVEEGIQSTSISDFDSVIYSSPNGDFQITNNSTYEQDKTITCTNPGTYNDSIDNFIIIASRSANNSSNTFSKNIEVADIAPELTITQPVTNMRSSASGEDYLIQATSNQNLSIAPDIGIPISGTWKGIGFEGSDKIWTRTITIQDSDIKGQAAWTLDNSPTNNAGIIASSIFGNETVGGFLSRAITINAWPNREGDIGTDVYDTSKLICENTSKGGDGPNGGTIFTYSNTIDDEENKFTITSPTSVPNSSGNLWYNKDLSNAVANSTGSAIVYIEET